jgi:hypothetical protein
MTEIRENACGTKSRDNDMRESRSLPCVDDSDPLSALSLGRLNRGALHVPTIKDQEHSEIDGCV